jgi:hypothetical protein
LDAVSRTAKTSQKYKVETIFPKSNCRSTILTNFLKQNRYSDAEKIWNVLSVCGILYYKRDMSKTRSLQSIQSYCALGPTTYPPTTLVIAVNISFRRKRFNTQKFFISSLIYIFFSCLTFYYQKKNLFFILNLVPDYIRWQKASGQTKKGGDTQPHLILEFSIFLF